MNPIFQYRHEAIPRRALVAGYRSGFVPNEASHGLPTPGYHHGLTACRAAENVGKSLIGLTSRNPMRHYRHRLVTFTKVVLNEARVNNVVIELHYLTAAVRRRKFNAAAQSFSPQR
jgi:hypothetical protein